MVSGTPIRATLVVALCVGLAAASAPPSKLPVAAPSNPTLYAPWQGGLQYKCTSGNCGTPGGHVCDQVNRYAWDFVTYGGASTLLVAVADGTVVYVQESIPDSVEFCSTCYHAGNVVVIRHASNRFSYYAHLKYNSVRVSAGQSVSRGAYIADMGQSGYAYGVHLHFSIMSSWWSYSQYGYETASGVSVAASFADIGNPRKGDIRTSGNYHCCQCAGQAGAVEEAVSDDGAPLGAAADRGATRCAVPIAVSVLTSRPTPSKPMFLAQAPTISPARGPVQLPATSVVRTHPQSSDTNLAITAPARNGSTAVELNAPKPSSTNYRMLRSVSGTGGGTKASTGYSLRGTSGQPVAAGQRLSETYVLHSGYWGWRLAVRHLRLYFPLVLKEY